MSQMQNIVSDGSDSSDSNGGSDSSSGSDSSGGSDSNGGRDSSSGSDSNGSQTWRGRLHANFQQHVLPQSLSFQYEDAIYIDICTPPTSSNVALTNHRHRRCINYALWPQYLIGTPLVQLFVQTFFNCLSTTKQPLPSRMYFHIALPTGVEFTSGHNGLFLISTVLVYVSWLAYTYAPPAHTLLAQNLQKPLTKSPNSDWPQAYEQIGILCCFLICYYRTALQLAKAAALVVQNRRKQQQERQANERQGAANILEKKEANRHTKHDDDDNNNDDVDYDNDNNDDVDYDDDDGNSGDDDGNSDDGGDDDGNSDGGRDSCDDGGSDSSDGGSEDSDKSDDYDDNYSDGGSSSKEQQDTEFFYSPECMETTHRVALGMLQPAEDSALTLQQRAVDVKLPTNFSLLIATEAAVQRQQCGQEARLIVAYNNAILAQIMSYTCTIFAVSIFITCLMRTLALPMVGLFQIAFDILPVSAVGQFWFWRNVSHLLLYNLQIVAYNAVFVRVFTIQNDTAKSILLKLASAFCSIVVETYMLSLLFYVYNWPVMDLIQLHALATVTNLLRFS